MKRVWQLLLILVGLIIFAIILIRSGADGWSAVWRGDWRYLLLALLSTGLAQMISAWRLQGALETTTARATTATVRWPWRATYHVTMTAQLVGMIMPRFLSAIGGKAAALKAYDTDLKESIPAVLLDKFLDVLLMAPLMVPGFLYALGQLGGWGLFWSYLLLALAVLSVIYWVPAGSHWLMRLAKLPWIGPKIHSFFSKLLAAWPHGSAGLILLLQTVVLNIFLAARFHYVALALGLETDLTLFLALFPIAQLSLIIALAPGGLGVFDLSWLGLLTLAGVAGADEFAVAQRVYVTVINLFWGGFAMLLALTLPRPAVVKELS